MHEIWLRKIKLQWIIRLLDYYDYGLFNVVANVWFYLDEY